MYTSLYRRVVLTIMVTILIALLGAGYQFYFIEERAEYEDVILSYYNGLGGHELDKRFLRHLSTLAIERYGLIELLGEGEYFRMLVAGQAQ